MRRIVGMRVQIQIIIWFSISSSFDLQLNFGMIYSTGMIMVFLGNISIR